MVRADQLRPLPELLRAGAGRTGIAFADVRREVTHAELAARTERLAGHLVDLGVRAGDHVAVLLDGVAGVESVLAAVRAGAVAVPLDSTVDDAELAGLLADVGTVVTDAAGATRVSPRTLIVDGPYDGPALDYEMLAKTDPVSAAPDSTDLDGVAFRCHTAGVTGPRRAVHSTQRNVLWSALGSYADVLSAKHRLLWTVPLHCGVAHVVAAISTGVPVWLAAGLNSTEVRHAIAEQQSTVVAANAAMFAQLRRVSASVRFGLLVGSGHAAPEFPLLTVYPITEAAGPVAMSRPGHDGLVPLPGVALRLTDDGEVLVGGPTVAVPTRDGWYRTGDLGTCDELGRLTVTGRIADLVRVGDEVVRLERVDAALRSVDGVQDAAIAHGPVAYVVADKGCPFPAAALFFTACRAALTAAAVPAELYAVREIPRTATGSALRHRLPGLPARLLGIAGGTYDTLFAQHWEPLPPPPGDPGEWAVAGPPELTAGLDVPGFVIDGHTDLETLVTSWLAEHTDRRLVLLTRGAVHAGGYAPDPARASAWGMGRAQQSRHPGQLVLVDADAVTEDLLAAAVASGEEELAVRAGELLRPNHTSVPAASAGPALSGRVVLVGGDEWLARHLLAAHEVRELLLVGVTMPGLPTRANIAEALEEWPVDAVIGADLPATEALRLHEATLAHNLSAFVLLSSGTDAYASAVADALVRHRHALQLPAVSITWTRPGFTELPPSWRTAMFDAALAVEEPCVVAGLRGNHQADAVRAALRERVLATRDRQKVLLDVVHAELAGVLGRITPEALEPSTSFLAVGLDWLTTARLRTRLCVATGLDLPATLLTDHPTPAALAGHLLTLLDADEVALPEEPVAWHEDPVAIIGIDPALLRNRDTAVFAGCSTESLRLAVRAVISGEHPTAVVGEANHLLALASVTTNHPILAVLRATPRSTVDVTAVVDALATLRPHAPVVVSGATITAPTPTEPAAGLPVVPWLLSAATEEELRAEARRLASVDLDITEVGRALLTRPTLAHRAAVTGTTRAELRSALHDVATGTTPSTVVTDLPRLAYLFTGQGAQRVGMGAELAAAFPVFARAFEEARAALDPHLPRPLNEVLNTEALHRTEFAQPALFAIEVALFRLLESWGVRPDYVAGHAAGELAAAHVAGVWSLPDAAHLVATRARLMQALPGNGVMISVDATEAEVAPLLSQKVAVAAVNSPTTLVLSGETSATLAAAEELADIGRKTRRLRASHAFHSPLMDPILPELHATARTIPWHEPAIPLISTLTGTRTTPTPEYWSEQARSPVRFTEAVTTLTAHGVRTFVELGPDTVLTLLTRAHAPADRTTIPTMSAKHPETRTITEAFGHLFTKGSTVDGRSFFPEPAAGPHS